MSRNGKGRLLGALRQALEGQGLKMVYQPKVSLFDGSMSRVEAVVRCDNPELGPV